MGLNSFHHLICFVTLITVGQLYAIAQTTADPIADYFGMNVKDRRDFAGTVEVLFRVCVDVNGDGKDEVFVGTPYRYSGSRRDFNWVAYTPVDGGYARMTPVDKDVSLEFEEIYIGTIAEIGRQGLVQAYDKQAAGPEGGELTTIAELRFYYLSSGQLVEKNRGSLDLSKTADRMIYDTYFGPSRRSRSVTKSETFTAVELRHKGYTIPNWDSIDP